MKAFIFDTETTGLVQNRTIKLDKQPEIIEFYGCTVDLSTGELIDEIDVLIRPAKLPLPPIITKITGLKSEMFEKEPRFGFFAPTIRAAIEREGVTPIAHNLSFDKDMVEIEFERLGEKIEWPAGLCTVEQSIHVKGFRLTLGGLHSELFGEPFVGAHRAKVDVAALTRCAVEMFKRGWL